MPDLVFTKWMWTLGKPLPLTVPQFLQVYTRVRDMPSAYVGASVIIILSPFPVKGFYIPAPWAYPWDLRDGTSATCE